MAEQSPRRSGTLGRVLERIAQRLTAAQAEETRAMRQEMKALHQAVEALSSRIEEMDTRAALDRRATAEHSAQELRGLEKQIGGLAEHSRRNDRLIERRAADLLTVRDAIKESIKDNAVELMTMAKTHKNRQDQLGALLRPAYLPRDLSAPLALRARRFRLLSQNEEDGITLALLEYNAFFGPSRSVTLPRGSSRVPRSYFGASLTALESAARRKGYGLVLCEPTGKNAFFIRDGLAPHLPRLTPEQAYQPPAPRGNPVPSPAAVFKKLKKLGLKLVEV